MTIIYSNNLYVMLQTLKLKESSEIPYPENGNSQLLKQNPIRFQRLFFAKTIIFNKCNPKNRFCNKDNTDSTGT